ncbi:hypothetical protein BD311DRAFT_665122, partial [Dichomitus squalens]
VNLFRILDKPEMLATAVYACCRLSPDNLVNGFERADGTSETLSPADLVLCLKAQRGLLRKDSLDSFSNSSTQ